jgi:hypothetical protein
MDVDWKKVLEWYMFHVLHEEGTTYASSAYAMSCMPMEIRIAIRETHNETMTRIVNNRGMMTKPDGTEY